MELVDIYTGLCDVTRLRIVNLLSRGELCVCHFQELLGEPQVKISKHLAYLRARALVETRREANWVVYSLPAKPSREFAANLACLVECARENAVLRRDLARLDACASRFAANSPVCCAPKSRSRSRRTSA